MSDSLYDILSPHFSASDSQVVPSEKDNITSDYLTRLTTLSLAELTTTEPQSLTQNAQSHLHSLQALSQRSHTQTIKSHLHLSNLQTSLPTIASSTAILKEQIPHLDQAALKFQETYNKSSSNPILERRREALLLSRNVDRLQDILDLPTLLATAISSATPSIGNNNASTSSAASNYATALDLNSHIKRLSLLYPESKLVKEVETQAATAMLQMCNNLIASLRAPTLKLAAAMRTISWIRRVAPDLEMAPLNGVSQVANKEGALGALFLLCRLGNLNVMLGTLEPLKELADQETTRRLSSQITHTDSVQEKKSSWAGGQQTERYLKRYIEIFREQSFAIISMFRSIFPVETSSDEATNSDPLLPQPSALSTFPLHLVTMLQGTLRHYLPNVQDRSSRDSLLTQVLYCAGSLGRLGGDFSMILSTLDDMEEDDDDEEDPSTLAIDRDVSPAEWMEVMKKHRTLAGKLEGLVGTKS